MDDLNLLPLNLGTTCGTLSVWGVPFRYHNGYYFIKTVHHSYRSLDYPCLAYLCGPGTTMEFTRTVQFTFGHPPSLPPFLLSSLPPGLLLSTRSSLPLHLRYYLTSATNKRAKKSFRAPLVFTWQGEGARNGPQGGRAAQTYLTRDTRLSITGKETADPNMVNMGRKGVRIAKACLLFLV